MESWKVKRKDPQIVAPDHKISGKDYYQISISILMVILGVVILFRSLTEDFTIMALLVGGGFLALGCYRLKFVARYLRERKK